MTKVLVIGIDALDTLTISKHLDELPNMKRLWESSQGLQFDGVFPPDSPTSWGSIFTGINPAKHGIVLFTDPLKRVSKMITQDVDDSTIRGRTVWDIASKNGKKVIVALHLLGYPPWDVNGIMIGRSGVSPDVQVTPASAKEKYDTQKFSWGLNLFPGGDKEKYVAIAREQITRQVDLAEELLRGEDADLAVISFGELDPISYSYWNYYDEHDPSFPGKNEFQRMIPDFYKVYDDAIGRLIKIAGPDRAIVLVSDHGIGSRPVKLVNINEVLRRLGYLKVRGESTADQKREVKRAPFVTRTKQGIVRFVAEKNLANLAAKVLKKVPKAKEWFISSSHIDWEGSAAYLTDQSGIKNYPYGGINVRSSLPKQEYEEVRTKIIADLLGIKDPENGMPVFNWVRRREELYQGEYLTRYPDVIFELREDFGAGGAAPAPLFGRSVSHNIAPGAHKQHHATFFLGQIGDRKIKTANANLMDVAPTVLDLLDIDGTDSMDGRSVFR